MRLNLIFIFLLITVMISCSKQNSPNQDLSGSSKENIQAPIITSSVNSDSNPVITEENKNNISEKKSVKKKIDTADTTPLSKPIQDNAKTIKIYNVDDLKNPAVSENEIGVKGVVSTVTPEQKIFTLIDLKEYEECNSSVSCATFQIPVKYNNVSPKSKDKIIAYGKIQKSNGKYLFISNKMEHIK